MSQQPDLFSIRAGARRVGRNRTTVQQWIRDGLPYHLIEGDRTKYILLADLQAWMRAQTDRAHSRPKDDSGRFVPWN